MANSSKQTSERFSDNAQLFLATDRKPARILIQASSSTPRSAAALQSQKPLADGTIREDHGSDVCLQQLGDMSDEGAISCSQECVSPPHTAQHLPGHHASTAATWLNGATSLKVAEPFVLVDRPHHRNNPNTQANSVCTHPKTTTSHHLPVTQINFNTPSCTSSLNYGVPAKSQDEHVVTFKGSIRRQASEKPTKGCSLPTTPRSCCDSARQRPASSQTRTSRASSPNEGSPVPTPVLSPVVDHQHATLCRCRPISARSACVGQTESFDEASNAGNEELVKTRGSHSLGSTGTGTCRKTEHLRLALRASGWAHASTKLNTDSTELCKSTDVSSTKLITPRERYLDSSRPTKQDGILQLYAGIPKVLCACSGAELMTGPKTARRKAPVWARKEGSPKHHSYANPEPLLQKRLPMRPRASAPEKARPRSKNACMLGLWHLEDDACVDPHSEPTGSAEGIGSELGRLWLGPVASR